MSLPARKINRALVHKLGFTREDRRHRVYLLKVNECTVAQTLMSHGVREVDDSLIARMARQLSLTPRQFRDLVNCPMSCEEYYTLLGI